MTEPVVTGVRDRAVVQAEFCKVFGNVQRVLILWSLADSELSVGDIARCVNGSLQNTSQHLHLMKNKGILTSRREGQTVYYCIARKELINNCPLLLQAP
jgi:DNA-binding transcriptional ArsR family regulator